MGGRHLSLPPPTYRNLLDWDCTIVLIPCFLPVRDGILQRLRCPGSSLEARMSKGANWEECKLSPGFHIPVSSFRPATSCPSSLFSAFPALWMHTDSS